MGGLGQITLSHKVYNEDDVKNAFDCRAWVCVSREFNVRDILFHIAQTCLSGEERKVMKEMELVELGGNVRVYLQGTKYLVVLDDVWSIQVWNCLKFYLPAAKNGSKVLITCRNEVIALHASSHVEIAETSSSGEEITEHDKSEALIYKLRLLNDEESLQLLIKCTFGHKASNILTSELKVLGQNIVTKCSGLPLAIKLVGSLLVTKEKTKSSWQKVLTSMQWHLRQGPESCMAILALSYQDLPYYLKSCFLYCGIFPEDSEIYARELISLWIAENFVERRGTEPLEEVAEDYLIELGRRSMLQVPSRKLDGRVKKWPLHDLLRDFAISEARDACLFQVHSSSEVVFSNPSRRLSIHSNDLLGFNNTSPQLMNSHIKSLLMFGCSLEGKRWISLKENIKFLSVLDLRIAKMKIYSPRICR